MCFRNQKTATKDLDLVFSNREDFRAFASAIESLGFTESDTRENAYVDMQAEGMWQNEEGFRFDLFVEIVCGELHLSPAMVKRAQLLTNYGNLSVLMVSNEDVILFKGITVRPADTTDIVAIIDGTDINWGIVKQECIDQSGAIPWYNRLYSKFIDINRRRGVPVPIANDILELEEMKRLGDEARRKGIGRESAKADLKKKGFSDKEIEQALGPD